MTSRTGSVEVMKAPVAVIKAPSQHRRSLALTRASSTVATPLSGNSSFTSAGYSKYSNNLLCYHIFLKYPDVFMQSSLGQRGDRSDTSNKFRNGPLADKGTDSGALAPLLHLLHCSSNFSASKRSSAWQSYPAGMASTEGTTQCLRHWNKISAHKNSSLRLPRKRLGRSTMCGKSPQQCNSYG